MAPFFGDVGAYSDLKRVTMTPTWGDAIASVKTAVSQISWKDEISWLWNVAVRAGYQQDDLARALGIDPSTVGRWNPEGQRGGPPKSPNESSQNAIADALDPAALQGWEEALSGMRATVEEMEKAARLRRMLIEARKSWVATRHGSDLDPLESLRRARRLAESAKNLDA